MTVLHRMRRRPLLSGLFVLTLALMLFFAVRVVVFSLVWSDPGRRDVAIEGWMTPGYVAHSWQVPRDVVAEALGPRPETEARGLTLEQIARERGTETGALIAALQAAIAAHRAAQPGSGE